MVNQIFTKKISKSYDYSLDEYFVAAAIRFDNGDATHAGIAICIEGKLYIFHYAGAEIILEELDEDKWYIENKLTFIKPKEVDAFFVYCENIQAEANPSYGFNYNGAYFLENGNYFSEVEDFQFMTCVGFCLAVITGAIEGHKYLMHEEWDMADHEKDAYFLEHIESLLDSVEIHVRNRIKSNLRRIYPIDYFSASFVEVVPISKKAVDDIKQDVIDSIIDKFPN
ncbi:hypothetical protein [Sphingobacterium gobiense]|uniref:Uncharacterized protein n=1 Tax=Sphingobacterium gobiense TaxID=1382456 RepID=A0A2S9JU08_9SPHI|nr:hypothetical protein [Sphingobacterium gobiense]PRD56749.1 hypothetical protein C5749_05840 [Sphingobacterium gobiense]